MAKVIRKLLHENFTHGQRKGIMLFYFASYFLLNVLRQKATSMLYHLAVTCSEVNMNDI